MTKSLAVTPASDPLDDLADQFHLARRLQTAVWVFDIDHARIVRANAPACQMWRAESEAELCARDLAKDMSSTVSKRLRQYQIDFEDQDAVFTEMWTLYPDGEPNSVQVNFMGYRLHNGRMAMLCEAITQTDDQPENLRSAEALLHTDVMITLFSTEGPPLYMNPAARNAATSSKTEFSSIFIDPDDHTEIMFELDRHGEHRMISRVRAISGAKWYDLSTKSCLDAVTGEPAILVTAIDVSELKTARDKARYLADRDQLTGCFNRSYLLNHMASLARCESKPCILLYFDVDRFKQINDSFGHELGDMVLQEISKRARKEIRNSDLLVRLGGDEFVILFENMPDVDAFMPSVNRILNALSDPLDCQATKIKLSASIGIAQFDPTKIDFTSVLRNADMALYVSKQAGRNRATVFCEEIGTAAKARDLLEFELRQAIEKRQFILHYQPRFDLNRKCVVSAEALVRWNHPDRGLIFPGDFIPICEETGMIDDLGYLVLEVGYRQAVEWARSGLDIGVSINISPRQFKDESILKTLFNYAKNSDFPKGKIELEITENVLIGDLEDIARKLQYIASLGYLISIDDFGTGYSNLSYISRFPLNCIKIDRSFIDQLPNSGPVVRLIITLAKQIGATVVAEGVEKREEFDWLAAHECDQIQGFYLHRPVEISDFNKAMEQLQFVANQH